VVAEGAGDAMEIAKQIREDVGIDPRVTVLGHIQRGGTPTSQDREMASRMGYEAVMAMARQQGNCVIATKDGHIITLEMEEALSMTKVFDMQRYQVLETLTRSNNSL